VVIVKSLGVQKLGCEATAAESGAEPGEVVGLVDLAAVVAVVVGLVVLGVVPLEADELVVSEDGFDFAAADAGNTVPDLE
jgi:hypothetical protein